MNGIYLDNNATTKMPSEVIKTMVSWCNQGNPSASYKTAKATQAMFESFRGEIRKHIGKNYDVIFTSGATESNCTILDTVATAYTSNTGEIPHFILSSIEHKSLLDCAQALHESKRIEFSLVQPKITGHVTAGDVISVIRPNTCMACIMHANNEIGAINDIDAIGEALHSRNVILFCDAVQTFGKMPLSRNIDAFSASFHKIHGPPGVGVLVVKKEFYKGYKLKPLLFGSQNNGMRGGTENVPGIGASYAALKYTMQYRNPDRLYMMKKFIVSSLAERFLCVRYDTYLQKPPKLGDSIGIVLISGGNGYLVNTIFLSIIKFTEPYICNKKIKELLYNKDIIISVGSACNTKSDKASHVLYALNADEYIRKGALRISLGDETTPEMVKVFLQEFIPIINGFQ
jgi:cysteine desulfurase